MVAGTVALAAALALPAAPVARAQSAAKDACAVAGPGSRLAESAQYRLAWRSDPAPIPVGRLFALEVTVCPRAPGGTVAGLGVDARMPAQGHGMNYKPSVKPVGDGRYRVEGLMFHMPGQWELVFELREAGRVERIVQALAVR
jgi:hypothetical protein